VILCNRSVAEDNAFFERMKLLLEKKSSLLPSRTALLVKYAILFLNKNYAKPLTRESLASQLGIAEDYLSRIFKKEMGLTLWNYLTLLRLDFARREILLTGDSVAAIALRSGFADPAYFDRLFKKQYGSAPTTLRH
jgi:AraC-like DNA-binding protein